MGFFLFCFCQLAIIVVPVTSLLTWVVTISYYLGYFIKAGSLLFVSKLCRRPGRAESESLCLRFCPSRDLVSGEGSHSHHSQSQHIAFGIAWEQKGFLASDQVLSFLLSSCHNNGILYIVLCLLMGVDNFVDCERRVPLRYFLKFLYCGYSWCEASFGWQKPYLTSITVFLSTSAISQIDQGRHSWILEIEVDLPMTITFQRKQEHLHTILLQIYLKFLSRF